MNNLDVFIGVDIGGSSVKIGVVDRNCKILHKEVIVNNISDINIFFNDICSILDKLYEQFNIKSIGVGVPGIVRDEVLYIAPNFNYPDWHNIDIGKIFRKRFSCSITIDNDAKAAAIAELKYGAGMCFNDFVYITLGTGIGGAVIINKNIYRGMHNAAGEIGHLIIESKLNNVETDIEVLNKYRLGVVEEYFSKYKIIELANNLLKENNNSILYNRNFDVVDISYAAQKGDKVAIECLVKSGEYLGIAIANIVNLLDITNFVIGGGIARSNDIMFKSALETAKLRAIPAFSKDIILKQAKFLDETGIIGAALLGKS